MSVITFSIVPTTNPDGYQAIAMRYGSTEEWTLTDTQPSEDAVMDILTASIFLGSAWDFSDYDLGDWSDPL